jgi:hypothetical protein
MREDGAAVRQLPKADADARKPARARCEQRCMNTGKNHWNEFHRAWSRLAPPLRPNHEVVAAVTEQVHDVPGSALLLGVTPELAHVGSQLIALDHNHAMVRNIWPGNSASRWAVVGNWLTPCFRPEFFAVCVGDASLNNLQYPVQWHSFCRELKKLLRPGGRFTCRITTAPESGESTASVKDAVLSGAIGNFHAFKMRLSIAVASENADPRVAVTEVLDHFDRMFPDRDELAQVTGWRRDEIDTIDFYKNSSIATTRPTCRQVLAVVSQVFPNARFVSAGSYELADRCPLLVMDKE